MAHHYVPEAARGVRWDDPAFGIDWPARRRRTHLRARRGVSGLRAVKRVLVTGGSAASSAAGRSRRCAERGYEVHAPTSREADLLEPGAAERADRASCRPTHLLHLAWYAEPGEYWTSPENLDWVEASLRLLRAFERRAGAVFAGTCAEYEWERPRRTASRARRRSRRRRSTARPSTRCRIAQR